MGWLRGQNQIGPPLVSRWKGDLRKMSCNLKELREERDPVHLPLHLFLPYGGSRATNTIHNTKFELTTLFAPKIWKFTFSSQCDTLRHNELCLKNKLSKNQLIPILWHTENITNQEPKLSQPRILNLNIVEVCQ